MEAVEGGEVEGEGGGVGDGEEAGEFGGDELFLGAGRKEDAQTLGTVTAEERFGFLAGEALLGGASEDLQAVADFCKASSGAMFMAARSKAVSASFAERSAAVPRFPANSVAAASFCSASMAARREMGLLRSKK